MAIQTVRAALNGNVYNLTYNSATDAWEASIPAPAASSFHQEDNKFGVTVTAVNDAGTSGVVDRTSATFGSALALRVLEKQKPVINILSPGSGAYITTATPTFSATLLDNAIGGEGDSGIDLASIVLKLDGNIISSDDSGIVITPISGGYSCAYTPSTGLSEGSHTLTVDVADNDGNAASQATRTFKVDTVPPSLNVTSPADGIITNTGEITVEGITNDTTSTPVTVAISLNGVDTGAVIINSDGSFSKVITLASGENTIRVTSTDSAGKSSVVTKTVTFDTSIPVFTEVTLVPNPADAGATLTLTVKVH